MLRHALHIAVAVVTCVVGTSVVGILNFVGTMLAVEPPVPIVRQESPPECNTSALSAEQEKAKQEILEILRQYDIAQTNHDPDFFERAEADSFVLTKRWDEQETYTRDEAIAAMKTWPRGIRYASGDIWVQFYGDAAIVTGRMTATDDGGRYQHSWPWLHVFLKRGGRWQILSTTQVG